MVNKVLGGAKMRRQLQRMAAICAVMATVGACTVPRGAALQSEIIKDSQSDRPTYAVEPVTRARLETLNAWPRTGDAPAYRWFSAKRGPQSRLIQSGDIIDLTIWDSDETSLLVGPNQKNAVMGGLEVTASGDVFIPYVGKILLRGLTPDQARARVQSKVETIAGSAQVQLRATAGDNNSIDVVSGVNAPGSFGLKSRNITVLSMIAQAGGIDKSLRNPLINLMRDGKNYRIPVDQLLSTPSKNVTLRGGDRIVVQEDERYFIAFGATGNEELVYFQKDHLSALEALSLSGGINDNRANPKGVLILREYAKAPGGTKGPAHRHVVFTLDLTSADGLFAAKSFRINPQDTVMATESPVGAARTVLGLIGSIVGINDKI